VFKKICVIVALICLLGLYSQAQPQEQEKKIITTYFPTVPIIKTIRYFYNSSKNTDNLYSIIFWIATEKLHLPISKNYSIFYAGDLLPYNSNISMFPSNSKVRIVILPEDKNSLPMNIYTFWRRKTSSDEPEPLTFNKHINSNGMLSPRYVHEDIKLTAHMMTKHFSNIYKNYSCITADLNVASNLPITILEKQADNPSEKSLPILWDEPEKA
jgi:hypothetical protein